MHTESFTCKSKPLGLWHFNLQSWEVPLGVLLLALLVPGLEGLTSLT